MFASKRLGKVGYLYPRASVFDFFNTDYLMFRSSLRYLIVPPMLLRPEFDPSVFIQIQQSLPPGIELVTATDFKEWQMDIRVLDTNPLYQDQTYRLRFRFSGNYPIGTPFTALLYIGYTSDLLNTKST